MLVCVANPTRQPTGSSPARAVTMNIGYSRLPTTASNVARRSTSGGLPRGPGALRGGGERRRRHAAVGVGERVVEHVHRILALAHLDGEGLAGLRVADRDQ